MKTSYLLENTLLEVPDDENLNDSTSQNLSLNQSVNAYDDKLQRFDVIQRYLESTSIESPEIPDNDLGISTIKGNNQSQTLSNCASTSKIDGDNLKNDNESFKLSENTFDPSLNINQPIDNSPIKCVDDIESHSRSKIKTDKVCVNKIHSSSNEDSCLNKVSVLKTDEIANIELSNKSPTELKENENIVKDVINPENSNPSGDLHAITEITISDITKLPSDKNAENTVILLPPSHDNDKVWGSHLNKSVTQKTPDATSKKSNTRSKKVLERSASFNFVTKLFDGSKFKKRNPRRSLNKTLSTSAFSIDLSTPVSKATHEVHLQESQGENAGQNGGNILEKDQNIELEMDFIDEKLDIKITKQISSLLSSKNESNLLNKVENKTINTKLNNKWIERCDNQIKEETKKFVKTISVDSGIESTNSQCTTVSHINEPITSKSKVEIDPSIPSNSFTGTNEITSTNNVQTPEESEPVGLNMSNEKLLAMFNR